MQFFNFGVGFLIRGGAKDKQSKAKSKSKVEIRRSARYEDDDEDDDDSDYKSKGRSKKVSPKPATKSKKGSGSKKLQLIPWNDSKGKRGNAKINWKERLEQIAKQGQAAYKEVYRRAKVKKLHSFLILILMALSAGPSIICIRRNPSQSDVAGRFSCSARDFDRNSEAFHSFLQIWTVRDRR